MDQEVMGKETWQQLVKDLSDNLEITTRSTSAEEEHTPVIGSDKLLVEATDPSATVSVTRSGVQDDHHSDRGESSARTLAKRTADEEMASEAKNFDLYRSHWESTWGKTCGSFNHASE